MIFYYIPLFPLFLGLLYNNKDIFISNYYLFKSERLFLWIFLLFVMILTGFKGYIDQIMLTINFILI